MKITGNSEFLDSRVQQQVSWFDPRRDRFSLEQLRAVSEDYFSVAESHVCSVTVRALGYEYKCSDLIGQICLFTAKKIQMLSFIKILRPVKSRGLCGRVKNR